MRRRLSRETAISHEAINAANPIGDDTLQRESAMSARRDLYARHLGAAHAMVQAGLTPVIPQAVRHLLGQR